MIVIVLFTILRLLRTGNRTSKPTFILPFSGVQHMGDGLVQHPLALSFCTTWHLIKILLLQFRETEKHNPQTLSLLECMMASHPGTCRLRKGTLEAAALSPMKRPATTSSQSTPQPWYVGVNSFELDEHDLAHNGGEQSALLLLPPRFDPPTQIAKLAHAAHCQTGGKAFGNLQLRNFHFQQNVVINFIELTHWASHQTGEP